MSETETAIIKALAYAAVFNFPLTREEIHKYLEIKAKLADLRQSLKQLHRKKMIGKKGDYYFLFGKEDYSDLRKQREQAAKPKWKKAREIANKLARIKSVEAILVTGTLSVNNTDISDDIDMMIITQENRLWSCRLAVTFWLEWWRERRRPEGKTTNKICVNLYIDRSALEISRQRRSLFTAHEMVQAVPIVDKHRAYREWQKSNSWVSEYLPNAWSQKELSKPLKSKNGRRGWGEKMAYWIQKLYMQRRITNEVVGPHTAWFHPGNTSQRVMDEYEKILKPMLTTKVDDSD